LFRHTVLFPRRRARALCRGDSLGPTPPEAHQRHHRAEARALLRAFGNAGSRAPGTPRAAVVVARRLTARRRRGGAFAAAAARGAPAVGVHLAPSALRAERPPGLVHRPPEGEHPRPRASRGTRIRRASRVRRRVALVGADAGDGHRPDGIAIEPAPSGARLRGVTAGVRARASRVSPRGQTTASEVPAATRREVWPRSPSRNFVSSHGDSLSAVWLRLVDPDRSGDES
jgi:hypothetical protein